MGQNLLRIDWAEPGTPVAMVFFDDGRPGYADCEVAGTQPLTLRCADQVAEQIEPGRRVLLVLKDKGHYAKAETRIRAVRADGQGWLLYPDDHAWELLEQRRFPRYRVQVPAHVRLIQEGEAGPSLAGFDGQTVDVSLGGAWVETAGEPETGSLVDFRIELPGAGWQRMLAVVARKIEGKEGFAVEFVEYIGGARFNLQGFLERAA